ncbi:MAG TPA: hypothetical protein PK186_09500 [candidate division Zixibacteria bacterium]|nr:hypothetical protein [candidate division Zixibacteria bacterium]
MKLQIRVFVACLATVHDSGLVQSIVARVKAKGLEMTLWPSLGNSEWSDEEAKKAMWDSDAIIALLIDDASELRLWNLMAAVLPGDSGLRAHTHAFVEQHFTLTDNQKTLMEKQYRFDRKRIEACTDKFNLVKLDLLSMGDKFVVTQAKKEAIVFPSGLGCVKYEHAIKVAENDMARLPSLPGYYSMPDLDAKDGSKRLILEELATRRRVSGLGLYFGYKILRSPDGIAPAPKGIVDSELSGDLCRRTFRGKPYYGWFFQVILNRELMAGEEVLWKYGFVRTRMFPTHEEWTDYRAIYPVELFDFEVTFVYPEYFGHEPEFSSQPQIEHTDVGERPHPMSVSPEVVRDIDFVRYAWRGISSLDLGDRVRVKWTLVNA